MPGAAPWEVIQNADPLGEHSDTNPRIRVGFVPLTTNRSGTTITGSRRHWDWGSRMPPVVIEHPILNSPYTEPRRHFKFSEAGINHCADEVLNVYEVGGQG